MSRTVLRKALSSQDEKLHDQHQENIKELKEAVESTCLFTYGSRLHDIWGSEVKVISAFPCNTGDMMYRVRDMRSSKIVKVPECDLNALGWRDLYPFFEEGEEVSIEHFGNDPYRVVSRSMEYEHALRCHEWSYTLEGIERPVHERNLRARAS